MFIWKTYLCGQTFDLLYVLQCIVYNSSSSGILRFFPCYQFSSAAAISFSFDISWNPGTLHTNSSTPTLATTLIFNGAFVQRPWKGQIPWTEVPLSGKLIFSYLIESAAFLISPLLENFILDALHSVIPLSAGEHLKWCVGCWSSCFWGEPLCHLFRFCLS